MSNIPTNAESLPGDHLDRLIHGHLDDSLSAEQVLELEGFLRDSAAARARFWELAEVDGLGRDAARLAWGEFPPLVPSDGDAFTHSHPAPSGRDSLSQPSPSGRGPGEGAFAAFSDPKSTLTRPTAGLSQRERHESDAGSSSAVDLPDAPVGRMGSEHDARRRWITAAVAGAVVSSLVAVVFAGFGRSRLESPGLNGNLSRDAATAVPVTAPLAAVTNTRFLLAEDGATPLAVGQTLAAGEITLLGGAVELTLRNGVVIILEGPGEIELRDELSAFLHAGSVVVRMPEGMTGFRLDTATTDVLDLGTEFAVKAAPGFVTDVQVFDGAVVASSKSAGDNASFPARLEAGQAARFSSERADGPQPIPYAESRFIRRLPPDTGLPTTWGNDDEASLARVYGRPQHDAIVVSRAREPITIDGRLDDWRLAPGFKSSLDGTDSCPEWADGRMMYDDRHLYIAAHVGDPVPLRSSIDPAVDPDIGWRGGSVQVRISTDRKMGWPVAGNSPSYYASRRLVPAAEQKALADNPRLAHLTMWFHAASQTPCLTICHGMLVGELIVNPVSGEAGGFRGAFARDADGKGYTLEYAIPWQLLNCADDPPQAGDELAAAWQVIWSDDQGRLMREHMVEIRNPHEPRRIKVFERGATWGRAEYR